MSKPISELCADDFEPHHREQFRLSLSDAVFDLELAEVRRLGAASRAGGAFSLLFHAAPGPVLRQAIYPIEHPVLGPMELFVVPINPEHGKNRYEVVFT